MKANAEDGRRKDELILKEYAAEIQAQQASYYSF